MYGLKLSKSLFGSLRLSACIVTAIAGCIMTAASLLPWLRNPLGGSASAWSLPIYLGWQLPMAVFNYGALCLCCACYCFFLCYVYWKANKADAVPHGRTLAGLLCLMPIALFLLQYLFFDFGAMSLLAQQKNEMLLVQRHFGYGASPDFFPLQPFSVDISTIQGRFQLLVDQLQIGGWVIILCSWILLDYRRPNRFPAVKQRPVDVWVIGVTVLFFLLFLTMLVRAVGWEICKNMAAEENAQGNYVDSLQWLDRALLFDPSLDDAIFYHVERGQVLYLEYLDQPSDDNSAYVASLFSKRNDYQDAYRQLVTIWRFHPTTPWVVDDLSGTLESLAESSGPIPVLYMPENADVQRMVQNDSAALPWIQLLIKINSRNIYSYYLMGRIAFDLRDYDQCNNQLSYVLGLSADPDFQSSVYTYMALSKGRMGDYSSERILLLQAVKFDPAYRNNIARQELSGLR